MGLLGVGLGLGLGLGPGNAIVLFFSLVLQSVVNIFVFVGSVASYEYDDVNRFKQGELSETHSGLFGHT